MKIKIEQSSREPWGRLSIEDTRTASRTLSGDAFKLWVELALNQDGYTYKGVVDRDLAQELVDTGYMYATDTNSFMFNVSGNAKEINVPESWSRLAELYGVNRADSYRYVLSKLSSVSLDSRTEDILKYWLASYKKLSQCNRDNVKNTLRYDFAIILTWWVKENFRFEIGDIIVAGPQGKRLRFHNAVAKAQICKAIAEQGSDVFVIHERNKPYWDDKIGRGLIELSFDAIGEILRARKACQ